jgi:hypothetical protein
MKEEKIGKFYGNFFAGYIAMMVNALYNIIDRIFVGRGSLYC